MDPTTTAMTDQCVDLLAFAPHPDDVELACGGSLILAVERGLRVAIADLTEGENASSGSPQERAQEKQQAAQLLGVCARYSLGLPDTAIAADPDQQRAVIGLIRRIRPRIVLAPYRQDRHPDHAAASQLVEKACFFAGVSTLGEGPAYRPQRLFYYPIHEPIAPSFVIDVSTVWSQRMDAVRAYRSQFFASQDGPVSALNQGDFLRFIEARAVYYGAMIGARYGEAFYLPGPVPLGQFPDINRASDQADALSAYSTY